MLRITQTESPGTTQTLKLEGKLLEPWVEEVRWACAAADGRLNLDLSGLTFVDQAGARLLRDLLDQGLTVCGCSGFVSELLHLEKS